MDSKTFKTIKIMLIAAACVIMAAAFCGVSHAAQDSASFKEVSSSSYKLAEGVTEESVVFLNNSGKSVAANIVTIEPGANIAFRANVSGYYTKGSTVKSRKNKAKKWKKSYWKLNTVAAQVAQFEKVTSIKEDAIVAVNADFYTFNPDKPVGNLIMEGNKNLGSSKKEPFFAYLKNGTWTIRAAGSKTSDVKESVGGVWMVRNDKIMATSTDIEPRQAIGIKRDGTCIIMSVAGRQPSSYGATLSEVSEYMRFIGCYYALNLDGGGSVTFASRRAGAKKLTMKSVPSDGYQRVVSSTLMVTKPTKASSAVPAKATVTPSGARYTPGSVIDFGAKFYNASGKKISLAQGKYTFSLDPSCADMGSINASTGVFTGKSQDVTYTLKVNVNYGGKTIGSASVTIVPADSISFSRSTSYLQTGEKSNLGLNATAGGQAVNLAPSDVTWSVANSGAGSVSSNIFTAGGTAGVSAAVTVTSKFDSAVKAGTNVSVVTDEQSDSFGTDQCGLGGSHDFSTHSGGRLTCTRCAKRVNASTSGYTGFVTDSSSGALMLYHKGKAQTGFVRVGTKMYLFSTSGIGMTKTVKIGKTKYYFVKGRYSKCSDKKAGTIDMGFCGANNGGKNLLFVYHSKDKLLNVGLNPLIKKNTGKMKDWPNLNAVPWQQNKYRIKSVYIGNGVKNVGKKFLYTKLKPWSPNMRKLKPALKSVRIPSSVTKIGAYAFFNQTSLRKITLPAKVKSVGTYAFGYTTNITIRFTSKKPPTIGKKAFVRKGGSAKKYRIRVPNTKAWKKYFKSKKLKKALKFTGRVIYK